MNDIKQSKRKSQEAKKPVNPSLSTEERLRIIANLIIDRIIEDQLNGSLHLRTKQ